MKKFLITSILVVFALAFGLVPSFSQEPLISVNVSNNSYVEGETIVISGKVATIIGDAPLTIQIFNLGNLIEIVQLVVAQDGSFTTTILAEGGQWQDEGDYTVRASYGEGNIAEANFEFFKKPASADVSGFFEVNAGSSGTFDVEYIIRGGTVKDMIVDLHDFALIVIIDSAADGIITLDLPRESIDAKKSDGSDDLFIVLIDGIEVIYDESITNEKTRTITIQFEEGDSDIEVIGTYIIPPGSSGVTTTTSPGFSSYEGIYYDSTFRVIPERPNVGSTIRIIGEKFGENHDFEFLIDSRKIGSFTSNQDGSFIFTVTIPDDQSPERVDFIIRDSRYNEKSLNLRLGEKTERMIREVPFTAEIVPLVEPKVVVSTDQSFYNRTDVISISGLVDPRYGSIISLHITNPQNQKIWEEDLLVKDDGSFSTLVIAGGDGWRITGNYILTANYEGHIGRAFFEFKSTEIVKERVPGWIKNNAKWWSEGQIDDDTFISGIQFLMQEKIINIPDLPEQASEKARLTFVDPEKDPQSYVDRYNNEASYKEWFDKNYPEYTIEEAVGLKSKPNVPDWIKNNAQWWADGLISENDFVQGIEYLVGKGIIKLKDEVNPLQKEEINSLQKEEFNFVKSRNEVLFSLSEVRKAHNFDIVFDKDLTSEQKEGAIFHTYKIVHETDGRIGDLTFYFGKPDLFPSTDFDKIFRVKFFISNEYGVAPTSAALPIIKSSLEELVPEWNMINKDQTSSDWIDDIIQYGQSGSSGEKNETIRSDQQEIKFAYNEEGLGFAELIITQKIS